MTKNVIFLVWMAFLASAVFAIYSSALTQYTKETEFRPIRLSDIELQREINKISSLIQSANAASAISRYREKVVFSSGKSKVEMSGPQFTSSGVELPRTSYDFEYSFSTFDEVPISDVSIRLGDVSRRVSVSGNSPEQVDAIFSTIESDFKEFSTIMGGLMVRIFGYVFFGYIFLMGVILGSYYYYRERNVKTLGVPIFSLVGLILLAILPLKDILAGFAVYQGEASFLVRYGYQISFASLLLALVAIPLSYYLPRLHDTGHKHTTESKPSNNGLQRTPRKRR